MANQVYPLVMTAPPRHDESGSFSFPADTALPGWLGSLPASWRPYAMLARLDRPVGIWLLYLPCVIGLAFQRLSSGLFLTDLAWAALFFIGAAILTPPDVVTQVMMAACRPLVFLLCQCFCGLFPTAHETLMNLPFAGHGIAQLQLIEEHFQIGVLRRTKPLFNGRAELFEPHQYGRQLFLEELSDIESADNHRHFVGEVTGIVIDLLCQGHQMRVAGFKICHALMSLL